jgi:hypothetical protein
MSPYSKGLVGDPTLRLISDPVVTPPDFVPFASLLLLPSFFLTDHARTFPSLRFASDCQKHSTCLICAAHDSHKLTRQMVSILPRDTPCRVLFLAFDGSVVAPIRNKFRNSKLHSTFFARSSRLEWLRMMCAAWLFVGAEFVDGVTSTSDALYALTPVIATPGIRFASRVESHSSKC